MSTITLTPRDIARFWAKVDKTGDCWLWTAGKFGYGYGQFRLDGRGVGAHRVSYTLSNGQIPDGLFIDHICHNRACVNPLHLRTVTRKQNAENILGPRSSTTSGVLGVYRDKRTNVWRVEVRHFGRRHHGGQFVELEDAKNAAINLRNKLFTHNDADRVA